MIFACQGWFKGRNVKNNYFLLCHCTRQISEPPVFCIENLRLKQAKNSFIPNGFEVDRRTDVKRATKVNYKGRVVIGLPLTADD